MAGRWRRSGLGALARHARRGFPHYADDFQEPRVLRPCLRRDRRCACAERENGLGRRGDRRVARRRLPGDAGGRGDRRARDCGRGALQHALPRRTALTHGSVRLAAFEPARLEDAATRSLMRRVEVALDPELDAAFPAQRSARVAIESHDGRRGEHLQPRARATRTCALRAELEHKYFELVSPVSATNARRLLARLWKLEREAAMRPQMVKRARTLTPTLSRKREREQRIPLSPSGRGQGEGVVSRSVICSARRRACRRLGRHREEQRAPLALPAQARLRGTHRPINASRSEVLGERAYRIWPKHWVDRPRLYHDSGDSVERALENAAHAASRRHDFQRRLRRRRPEGAARQAPSSRARELGVRVSAQQHGARRPSRTRRAHRQRRARDGSGSSASSRPAPHREVASLPTERAWRTQATARAAREHVRAWFAVRHRSSSPRGNASISMHALT